MNTLLASLFAKPTYAIRPIGAEQAESCARLHGASFGYGWSEQDFESYLADPTIVADGAVTETPRKGVLGGFVLSRLTPPDAEILSFAVEPARRGAGLGRALLDAHLTALERAGALLVFLEVADDNAAALALYQRAGFKVIGRRENYYQRANGEKRAALTMRLDI
jgi:[ribosomal protein S18]-alanine N-acetyltransferase